MTVVQLRKALEERGLDTKGLKAALVQRYQKALDNDAKNSAPADAGDDADKPAADDAVDVGDAKPDSAAAMDDDAFPSAATTRTTSATPRVRVHRAAG